MYRERALKNFSRKRIVRAERPAPTIAQAATAAKALLTGTRVSLEVLDQRTEICKECDWSRLDGAGRLWCGVCGCNVSRENKTILNLAAFEENLPDWGCKHPERSLGRGWGSLPAENRKSPDDAKS